MKLMKSESNGADLKQLSKMYLVHLIIFFLLNIENFVCVKHVILIILLNIADFMFV